MGKVYSYLRFSSKAQEFGDSKRRQLAKAHEYCRERGLTLEKTTFEDLGVSAWKGANFEQGQLGVFLRAVDEGLIDSDSTLLVEHLDRVTRAEPMVALELFTGIINRGLTLVTITDGQVYNKASIKGDVAKLLTSIIKLVQANEDNEHRSRRVREALAHNRASGKLSRRCPVWLTVSEDRTRFIVIPEKAAVVKRMFDMAVDGYGIYQIAQALNREGVPHLGKSKTPGKIKTWKGPAIGRLLRSTSVIGHQNARTAGEIRENFYPAIITPSQFYEAGESMDRRSTIGKGRIGDVQLHNLFKGLMRCECGEPIRFIRNKSRTQLRCDGALSDSGCEGPYFVYPLLEEELLAWLFLDAEDHLYIAEQSKHVVDESPELRKKIARRKTQQDRLYEFVMNNEISDGDAKAKLTALRKEINDLEEQLRKTEALKAVPSEYPQQINAVRYFEHYDAIMDGAPAEVLYDIRMRLQEGLRRSIKQITLMRGDWYEIEGGPIRRRFQVTFSATPIAPFELTCGASARLPVIAKPTFA